MTQIALLVDFGSTYTKIRAVDLLDWQLLATAQSPSTVGKDIRVGLQTALQDIERHIPANTEIVYRLASSSAAGGLRMVTIGLVQDLSAEAARRAALGAGARLVKTFSNRLTFSDLQELEKEDPDIILLAGGTDGGNREVILYNAQALSKTSLQCPIIYAGNRSAADEAMSHLETKAVALAENVMPELNVLNVDSAREVIRAIFIERIIQAKGIDQVREIIDGILMPTPAAVLEGARLIADGFGSRFGLGSIVIVDPGGATTDVHSICTGEPTQPNILQRGLPEPRIKRTVEGDLGIRINASSLAEQIGWSQLATITEVPEKKIKQVVETFVNYPELLAQDRTAALIESSLTRMAVRIAVSRHAGHIETVYTSMGPTAVQYGKDLSEVSAVIGTGGPIAHCSKPKHILQCACADMGYQQSNNGIALIPRKPRLYVDANYILFAVGLLSTIDPGGATDFGIRQVREIEG